MEQETISSWFGGTGGFVIRMLLYGWVLFAVWCADGLDKTNLVNSAIVLTVTEGGARILIGVVEAIWNKKC